MTIDLASFGDLLSGDVDGLGARRPPGAGPLVVVDLDTPGQVVDLERAPGLPFLVVGVSRSAAFGGPLASFDVVLVETSSTVPAPWVAVPRLEDALARLSSAVSRSPGAATVLAHVLRAGDDASFDRALVVESLGYSTLQGGPEFARWLAERPAPPARPAEGQVLAMERIGDDLHVILDRPHVRNALNAALRDALCEALAVAVVDGSVASVHLSGRGRDFCSGGDLDEFGTAPDPVRAHVVRTARSVVAAMAPVAARTVAHLHGACFGAGIEIPAAAGHVMATADTRIRLPELAMGLIPGAGGTVSMPRRIGRHRTAWLALTGSDVGAETALEWALVDEIVDADPTGSATPDTQGYSVD